MKPLHLYRMAGLPLPADEAALAAGEQSDIAPAVFGRLVLAAEGFLIAGGAWSPESFLALTDVERSAAVSAGQRLAARRALMSSDAHGGPLEQAVVMAQLDGGAAFEDARLRELSTRGGG